MLGIREVSRELHSGRATPSLNTRRKSRRGILRCAQNDKAAARDGDFTELFRLLGTSEAQRVIEGAGSPAPEYTRSQTRFHPTHSAAFPCAYQYRARNESIDVGSALLVSFSLLCSFG